MKLLLTGLFLWTMVHYIPSLGLSIKKKWISWLGEKYYMLSFAVIVGLSLLLIVLGWRSITPSHLYLLPAFTKPIALVLIVFAFVLFGSAKHATKIKQYIRHPQLLSIVLWSAAHLMLNGDTRSVLLFGWLGCWAYSEIILINKREGEWIKQPPPSLGVEIKGLVISFAILIIAAIAHPYISGVSINI